MRLLINSLNQNRYKYLIAIISARKLQVKPPVTAAVALTHESTITFQSLEIKSSNYKQLGSQPRNAELMKEKVWYNSINDTYITSPAFTIKE